MASSRRVGNYAQSANAVVRSSDQIFNAAMSGKPDYTAIAKEAIKGRSLERRAAHEAEGRVAQAGINAKAKIQGYKIAADAKKDVEKIKRPARRMAGILGGLGTLATTGAMYAQSKRDREEEAKERAASDARFNERQTKWMEMLQNRNSGDSSSEIEPYVPGEPPPMPTLGGGSSSSGGSDGGSSVSPSVSAQVSYDPGKVMTQDQVRALAIKVGFPESAAPIVSAIAKGESGLDPTNSTMRAIPGQQNLYQSTGEDSVGLMQINWGYHSPSGWLQDMGITKREQLFDPETNMKAALHLYKGQGGGFQDWTVYDKGIYKRYLQP